MSRLRSRIRELEYELGRYEEGCRYRDYVIGGLREDMRGQAEIHKILAAYIAELIGEEGKEISKDAITEKIGKYDVKVCYDEANGTYKIKAFKTADEGVANG